VTSRLTQIDHPRAVEPLTFALPGGAHALFTDRSFGNLSLLRGPGHERAQATREGLRETLSLTALVAGPQVHGTTVQRVTAVGEGHASAGEMEADGRAGEIEADGRAGEIEADGRAGEIEADGRATSLHGVGMMVLTADCLPVIVATEGAVVALHAGWRGLAAGVLEEGVAAVREVGEMSFERGARAGARVRARGTAFEELVAILGPCAGVCCYEVGPEVHELFPDDPHRVARNLDLKAIARHRLLRAGVQRVEAVHTCTICDHRFFSHRRQAVDAGRQAGVVWLD
jgi:copper oxidase (laccase) domain-containing protein